MTWAICKSRPSKMRYNGTGRLERGVLRLESLSQFDVHSTLPKVHRAFCTLWNGSYSKARNEGANSPATQILAGIYHAMAV